MVNLSEGQLTLSLFQDVDIFSVREVYISIWVDFSRGQLTLSLFQGVIFFLSVSEVYISISG